MNIPSYRGTSVLYKKKLPMRSRIATVTRIMLATVRIASPLGKCQYCTIFGKNLSQSCCFGTNFINIGVLYDKLLY